MKYEGARDAGSWFIWRIILVASKFAVRFLLYVPSMLFQRNNPEFRGENKQ